MIQTILFFVFFLLNLALIAEERCNYSFQAAETKLGFAAFKFTEKARVEAKFDSFLVLGKPTGKNLSDLARKVKFKIDVNSVNSGNPERDGKIKKFFFGEMRNTSEITGYFRNVKINAGVGQGELIVKMNQQERSIPIQIHLKEDKLELKGTMDVLQWNGRASIEALNKECSSLHTGTDGISKLWSEVEIFLTTTITKDCK